MHSLTLLIPCSLIPSMVGNGVKPIADYEPSMHQNSKNGEFDSIIVSIEPKQKEKIRRNCATSTDFWSE